MKKKIDSHEILDNVFNNIFIRQQKPIVIHSGITSYKFDYYLLSLLATFLASIDLFLRIYLTYLRNKSRDIVIREFWNLPLLFSSIFLLPIRQKLFFNINHNLKSKNLRIPIPIKILALMGYKFILFDGSLLASKFPQYIRKQLYCPFFPLPPQKEKFKKNINNSKKIIVGVVGDFRSEKINYHKLITMLQKFKKNKNILIFFGSQFDIVAKSIDEMIHFSTNTHKEYINFLQSLDYLIIFAKKESYYFRNSGTIMDAISCGTIPIVPNYPVFNSQISDPIQVGLCYKSFNELSNIMSGISNNKQYLKNNFNYYTLTRSSLQNIMI